MKVFHYTLIYRSLVASDANVSNMQQMSAKKETTIEAVGWLCARYPGNDGWGQKI